MRGIEQIAWLYDAGMAVQDRLGFRRWRSWLAGGARGRVLEVGCGTGRNLPLYGPAAALVVGVDPALDVLRAARRRAAGAPLVAASAEALPVRDDAFDTVVSGLAFCSVADPPRGLAEVKRVLAPGGSLRMVEHVRARRPLLARLQDLVQPGWTRFTGGCHPNRDTERSVSAAGFAIEADGRRERGTLRRFSARPRSSP
jgi:ubiquinone/menaquinone biosynthesis C-methylase UbiE